MKFNIGDRVVAVLPVAGNCSLVGKIGKVICLDFDGFDLGVEFDYYFDGHSCGGKGKQGHCRYGFNSDFILTYIPMSVELLVAMTTTVYKCRYDNKEYFIKLQKSSTLKVLDINGSVNDRGIIREV